MPDARLTRPDRLPVGQRGRGQRRLRQGEVAGVVESVKAAADVYAPIAGTVTEVNQDAADAPESVNADAYAAWLFKIKPANAADVDALLDAAGYEAAIG